MRHLSMVFLSFLLVFVPARLFAKVATSRITIEGNRLSFEITDPRTLAEFNIWSGPGTFSNGAASSEPQSFIVNWSQGLLAALPQNLPRYQVSFYGIPNRQQPERLLYVVSYAFDATTGHGYVYLPGKGDPWYSLDVSSILRGFEGHWFHAWSAWDKVAGPLVKEGMAAVHSLGDQATCFAMRRYLARRQARNSDETRIIGVATCIPARNVDFVAEPARYHGPAGVSPET